MEEVETLIDQETNVVFTATMSTLVHAAEDLDEGPSDHDKSLRALIPEKSHIGDE